MAEFHIKDKYDLNDFIALIDVLRAPGGCPWDMKQTHESIKRNVVEEAWEVCDAIDENDMDHLREELGDLLMQIIFHTSMEKEKGGFDMDAVADEACKKLVHRHPHVFGSVQADTPDEVLSNWDAIKRADRGQQSTSSVMDGIPRGLPGLMRSQKIQDKAAKLGFDWPDVSGAMDKLREDVLFSAVNVARFFKVDSEDCMHAACAKFIRRFRYMEERAAERGLKLEDMTLAQMEEIYQQGRHDLEGKEPVHFFGE